VALGGRPGARLLPALAGRASRTTLLRLVRATPATSAATRGGAAPSVLGVDEWAFRRGPPERRFGTILVDLVRHRPVDLLRQATAGAFATWLRAHLGARVISRDRGGAFADGAKQGAPHARQVADRFHLLRNLGHALKRVLQRHADRLKRVPAPAASADQMQSSSSTTAVRPERPDRRASREDTRQAMRKRYEAVQQLAATGMSTSAIARALGVHRHTVQKYRPLPAPPERRHGWRLPSLLAPYEAYLLERWRQGCHNAMALWRELEQRGFPGKYRTVARLVAHWKALARTGAPVPPPPAGLTPRQATALLLLRPHRRSTPEQRAVEQVRTVHPEIHTAVSLFDRFAALLRRAPPPTAKAREERLTGLARWIADAAGCGLGELEAFTTKLRQDLPAVQAAFTLPYSQGQTEGQITRLKALKRQMFGRANFDLLRQRFLLSAPATAPP
jgi:transposase